jgi:regulator of protease activity HflC (stomatin/prohibitin superfamily)
MFDSYGQLTGGGLAAIVLAVLAACGIVVALIATLHLTKEYEEAVIYRLGRFQTVKAGFFVTAPLIDEVVETYDMRVSNDEITVEKCLSKDMVPLKVDGILTWQIADAARALAATDDYSTSDTMAMLGEIALREIVGASSMDELLALRVNIDHQIVESIRQRASAWGCAIIDFRLRDVQIPDELNNAMSQAAQAERERTARLILAESEKQVAQSFVDAATVYAESPTALDLRRMNIAYEGLKSDQSKIIFVPTSIMSALAGKAAGA